jgi:hypothetical protein
MESLSGLPRVSNDILIHPLMEQVASKSRSSVKFINEPSWTVLKHHLEKFAANPLQIRSQAIIIVRDAMRAGEIVLLRARNV